MKRLAQFPVGLVIGLVILTFVLQLLVPVNAAFAFATVDSTHLGVGTLVVRLLNGELFWDCSGTLIAPQVFLTAGHWTSAVKSWLNRGLVQAAYVSFDTQFSQSALLVEVTDLVNHRYWDQYTSKSPFTFWKHAQYALQPEKRPSNRACYDGWMAFYTDVVVMKLGMRGDRLDLA